MPQNTSQLEAEFEEELLNPYSEAKNKHKYNPTRFIQMVGEHGGVETARRLLGTGPAAIQTGLFELWKCHRLDLSVEAKVLIPKYAHLFSYVLRDTARRRLVEREFDVDVWLEGIE